MADKKVYTIVINGITESFENIQTLNGALEALDKNVKDANATQSEQKSVMDELTKIQLKLSEFDRAYVEQVQRAKEELSSKNKEVKVSIQHENDLQLIEQGTAKTYKEKQQLLSALGRVIKSTNAETDEEKQKLSELVGRYNEVNNELKNFDKNMGNFQRNVGNYTSAFDAFDSSGQSMKERLREITEQMAVMAANGDKSSDAFRALAEEAGNIKDAMADARASINDFANDTKKLSNIIDVAKTATAAFGLLKGATAALGIENEGVVESIEKMQAAMAILNSLQEIQNQLTNNASGTYQLYHKVLRLVGIEKTNNTTATVANTAAQGANTAAMGAATVAASALKVALMAIGIGIITAAVALLIEYWDDLCEGFSKLIGFSGGVGEMVDYMTEKFNEFQRVVGGVWEVLKNILQGYESIAKVIMDILTLDFDSLKKHIDEVGEHAKNVYNVSETYNKGYTKVAQHQAQKRAKAEREAAQKMLEDRKKAFNDMTKADAAAKRKSLDLLEKEATDNQKKSKAYYDMWSAYYDKMMELYEDDFEKWSALQEEKKKKMQELSDLGNTFASEDSSVKPKKDNSAQKAAEERRKAIEKELEDLRKFEEETLDIQRQGDKEFLESQKDRILNFTIVTEEGLRRQEELLRKNLSERIALVNQELEKELEELRREYEEKMQLYEKLGMDTTQLTQAYNDRIIELSVKYGIEKQELYEEIEERILENQKAFLRRQFEAQETHLKEMQTSLNERLSVIVNPSALKDIKHKGGLLDGIVDAKATIQQLDNVKAALELFKGDVREQIAEQKKLLEQAKLLYGEESDEYKKKEKEIGGVIKTLTAQIGKADETIQQIGEKEAEALKKEHEAVLKTIEKGIGLGSDLMKSAFDTISAFMDMAIEEMQEKLDELDEMHSSAVEKVTESQDQIKSLNDEIANASGARYEKLKQQLADEELLLAQRQAEEQRLAKEKQKMEEQIAKKEKQQKKMQAVQSMIMAGINVAQGITQALALMPPASWVMAATTAAMGAVQIATIATQMSKLEKGGKVGEDGVSRSHAQGGHKIEDTNIEVEGGEWVINKKSSTKYNSLLNAINNDNTSEIVKYINSYAKSTSNVSNAVSNESSYNSMSNGISSYINSHSSNNVNNSNAVSNESEIVRNITLAIERNSSSNVASSLNVSRSSNVTNISNNYVTNNYQQRQLASSVVMKYASGGVLNYGKAAQSVESNKDLRKLIDRVDNIDLQPTVAVTDINNVQRNLVKVQELAGKQL